MRYAPFLLVGLFLALGAAFFVLLRSGSGPAPELGLDPTGPGPGPVPTERITDLDPAAAFGVDDPAGDDRRVVESVGLPESPDEVLAAEDDRYLPLIRGRVVDGGGRPLGGARVVAAGPDGLSMDLVSDGNRGWGQRWSVTTAADGTFALRGPGAGALRLGVRLAGYAPLDVTGLNLPAGEGADFGDLVVDDSVVLEGRVLVSGSGPVAGAELFREPVGQPGGMFFARGLPEHPVAVTDAAGRFRVDMLAAGPWKLRVESHGQPDRSFEGRTDRPGERRSGLEFLLEPGLTISGRVTDIPPGELEGLVVRAQVPRGRGFGPSGPVREAPVAADGSFEIGGCEEGVTYEVQARQDQDGLPFWRDRRTRTVAVEALAGASGLILPWTGTTGLTLQVVDPAGTPVEGFTLDYGAGFQRPYLVEGELVEHHPEGRVLLEDLSPDSWGGQAFALRVEAPGYEVFEREVELEAGRVVDLGVLTLSEAPVVLVRVLDTHTGAPVEGARVRLTVGDDDRGGFAVAGGVTFRGPRPPGGGDSETHSARSDASGLARVTSFPGRTARLRVSHDDHTSHDDPGLVLPATGALEHEVRLGIGGRVAVTVLDAFGEPVPGVRVEERTPPEPSAGGAADGVMIRSAMIGGGGPGEVTDDRGLTVFEHLTPGAHEFRLSDVQGGGGFFMAFDDGSDDRDGWSLLEVDEGGEHALTLHQAPRATLTGQVLEAGEPLAGATVALRPADDDSGMPGLGNLVIPGMAGPDSATTDGRGTFHIEGVEPGSFSLVVTHPSRVMPTSFEQVLVVGDNRRDVDLPVATIEGRVTDTDGAPLAGVDVEVVRASSGGGPQAFATMMFVGSDGDTSVTVGGEAADPTVTDADGRYRLRGVETGVDLVVEASTKTSVPDRSGFLSLADGQVRTGVDLVLAPAGVIEVELLDLGDGVFPMISIDRLGEGGEVVPGGTRGFAPGGTESFGGLETGRYRVGVELMGPSGDGSVVAPREVDVVAGQSTPVSFQL